jgi:predicted Zn-dependent peptidase
MFIKLIYIISAVILLTATVLAEHPRNMKFSPLEYDPPQPERFTTDNGMVVYFLEDHQLPVITGTITFHGGDGYDANEKTGLASVCASLLRSGGAGSRTPDEVDADLDYVGANISSNSDDEKLQLNFNCLKKDLELTFGIFSDMLTNPLFDSAKVNLELSNRKDGILRQNDNPRQVVRRVYYQTVYKGHPYGQYATLASIDNIVRDDLIEQHRQYYNPDNAILAVAGDLTSDELKELLAKFLDDWKGGGRKIDPLPKAERQYQPGVYYAERDINQAHIRFGHLGMDTKNDDRFAFEILNFALGGGGFTSRMMNQVRTTEGLAYVVYTYNYLRPSNGTHFAHCQTRADAMGKALKMMKDIIEEVRVGGITAEEMELSRESIINSYVFAYDTPGKVVNAQAMLEFRGFPSDQIKRSIAAYQAVTLDDCLRVAKEYIHPDQYAVIITGNREMFDQPLEDFGEVTDVSLEIK